VVVQEGVQVFDAVLNGNRRDDKTDRHGSRNRIGALFAGYEQTVLLLIVSLSPQQRLTLNFLCFRIDLMDEADADF